MFPFSIQRGDETGGATVYLLGEKNSLTAASKTGVLPNIAMFRDERARTGKNAKRAVDEDDSLTLAKEWSIQLFYLSSSLIGIYMLLKLIKTPH